jgi:hypothetical protein
MSIDTTSDDRPGGKEIDREIESSAQSSGAESINIARFGDDTADQR